MNRVVLCGRLAERPRLSTTATGLTVAILRLQVPRQGLEGLSQGMDVIDCLAFEGLARRLHGGAEPGLQINLEGWLLSSLCQSEEGQPAPCYRVAIEAAYWLDPRATALQPASPASPPEAVETTVAEAIPGGAEMKPAGFIRVHEVLARIATRFRGTPGKPDRNGSVGASCPSL
jgi:single-stranded DNA-binding protein